MSKPVLGRGLSALLGGKTPAPSATGTGALAPGPVEVALPSGSGAGKGTDSEAGRVLRVPVERVQPSALQPRRQFPEENLRELADSIREQGILQPLVVRLRGSDFELIAGERRWRAARLAGLTEVPVVVREADDATALEWMLVENLQREDLNPMDEAQGYAELMGKFALTQEQAATRVGRSRAAVANALRLLKLPADVQGLLRNGRVSAGHAKVILGLPSSEAQSAAAESVVRERLSVRQVEELVSRLAAQSEAQGGREPAQSAPDGVVRDPHVAAVEDRLRQRLGTRVRLRYRQGRGQIDIRFFSDAELERVLEILGVRLE